MWLRDYHLDGLRLDAVHALADHRAVHLLEQLAAEVRGARRAAGPRACADRRIRRATTRGWSPPGRRAATDWPAQWSDDFHHALHAALTGERQGYYCDFGSLAALAKTLARVFFHDGSWSAFRGRVHGRPVDVPRDPGAPLRRLPAGPRSGRQPGHRRPDLRATCPPTLLKVGAGLVLTAPFTPMLFMGEEWGAGTPMAVLHRPHRPRAGRGRRGRPPGRVRRASAGRRPRSPTRRTRRPSCARSWTGRNGTAPATASCSPGTGS